MDVGAFRYFCHTHCICICTSLSLSVRTVICHNLLSSTLTRLCEPLCMGRDAVSLVPRTYSQDQLFVTLQVTAEGKEPLALPLQLQQLAHTFVPMRSPTPRSGCSLCFPSVVEPLARQYPVWRHGAGSMFAFAGVQRPSDNVGRRVMLRRRCIEPCGASIEGE